MQASTTPGGRLTKDLCAQEFEALRSCFAAAVGVRLPCSLPCQPHLREGQRDPRWTAGLLSLAVRSVPGAAELACVGCGWRPWRAPAVAGARNRPVSPYGAVAGP